MPRMRIYYWRTKLLFGGWCIQGTGDGKVRRRSGENGEIGELT